MSVLFCSICGLSNFVRMPRTSSASRVTNHTNVIDGLQDRAPGRWSTILDDHEPRFNRLGSTKKVETMVWHSPATCLAI
jgi:hypothetical protein